MAHPTTRPSVWRAHDRRTASGTPGHALLNLKSGRRAGKAAARSRFDRADEPDAQRASRGRYLRVRHQTDEQTQEGGQYDRRLIVLLSNGEPVRAKSSHRPGRSPRSTYATYDRWDDSRRPQSHSAAPEPLIRRLAATSLSPACQRRRTHLAARARARSIELDRCAAATLKMRRRRSRPAQMMAVRATPRRGHHMVTHVKCDRH